jgi:hypothetical protein
MTENMERLSCLSKEQYDTVRACGILEATDVTVEMTGEFANVYFTAVTEQHYLFVSKRGGILALYRWPTSPDEYWDKPHWQIVTVKDSAADIKLHLFPWLAANEALLNE